MHSRLHAETTNRCENTTFGLLVATCCKILKYTSSVLEFSLYTMTKINMQNMYFCNWVNEFIFHNYHSCYIEVPIYFQCFLNKLMHKKVHVKNKHKHKHKRITTSTSWIKIP